jgi:hypothetical protein
MSIGVSTNFKERILGPESFESIFNGGAITLYTGTRPVSPDFPVNGVALGQVTTNGVPWTVGGGAGGLQFTRQGAWASKLAAADWLLKGSNTGAATWFRITGPNEDPGGLSYALPRLDGDMLGAIQNQQQPDFTLPVYTITPSTSVLILQFLLTLPPITGI